MDQAIVGSRPDYIDVQRRWGDCVDDAALCRLRGTYRTKLADRVRHIESLARQIRTNLFPVAATISRLPKRVGREIHQMRIHRRKQNWLCADGAKIRRTKNFWHDVLGLARASIVARQ